MTDDELAKIEKRANAAIGGPWGWEHVEGCVYRHGHRSAVSMRSYGQTRLLGSDDMPRRWPEVVMIARRKPCNCEECECHAEPNVIEGHKGSLTFIAYARTDVPALVAEVRRLRAELAAREAK